MRPYILLLALPYLGSAAPSNPPLALRQHDHGDAHDAHDSIDATPMDMGMGMAMDSDMTEGSSSSATMIDSVSEVDSASSSTPSALVPPDPHGHHSHAPVKTTLDDEDIHKWHSFPPTYLAADFGLDSDSAIFGEDFPEDWDPQAVPSHPHLMVAHVGAMIVSYFAALPITLALRAADHPSHYIANAVFLVLALAGWLAGVAYKASMPNMYEGAKHGSIGNILLLLSISLAALDSLGVVSRAVAFYRAGGRSWSSFITDAFSSTREDKYISAANRYEMVGLAQTNENEHDEDDEHEDHNEYNHQSQIHLQQGSRVVFSLGDDEDEDDEHAPRELPLRQATSRSSTGSDGTLHDTPTSSRGSAHMFEPKRQKPTSRGAFDAHEHDHHHIADSSARPVWAHATSTPAQSGAIGYRRAAEISLTWIRRTQVVIAYVCVVTGIPIYLGMCRAGFINTCAAHLIKGSIFFGYGILTFARYLGAYADLGWAWNRAPSAGTKVSAEMVECFVIFLYGITNTWMERFGSQAGDPYTVKQVQHISIAVMFWFAGLSGMLLESATIKRILGAVLLRGRSRVREPVSYSFSFNPLPALVIAVTGLAMAAHHQDYEFQVSIHSLWGLLLAGGSAFRFLTYFFLWLRPPTESTLPSRPPTELLTSFGWAAGGIVFMLSDEEVTFAAMRSGFGDMMAFLNFTIALTCLVFTWVVIVLAAKGYAVLRLSRGVVLDQEAR